MADTKENFISFQIKPEELRISNSGEVHLLNAELIEHLRKVEGDKEHLKFEGLNIICPTNLGCGKDAAK